jgi:ubiquinone/menaquinone biosynthesis C-methylase UbiE
MADRIARFVESMKVQPNDRVLEIGCGYGAAGTLICQRLRNGRYVGVDRSGKMIVAATKRNEAYVQADIARFVLAELESLDLGEERFDKVFAMRVRLFHDDPDRARELAEHWLAPHGRLFVEYDEPKQRVAS